MGFSQADVDLALSSTGRRCAICQHRHAVQLHHIVHRSQGGSDELENAIPLCPNCHNEVHSSYSSGRTTRIYTVAELRHFRRQALEYWAAASTDGPRVATAGDASFDTYDTFS